MTPEKFRELDEHFMREVTHVLEGKGQHYTHGTDRFSNFREAAELGGTTPQDEMLAALRKHVVGFFTLFKKDPERIPRQKFLEHGGDIINYIRLLSGLLKEGEGDDYHGCDLPDCPCQTPGELCVKER